MFVKYNFSQMEEMRFLTILFPWLILCVSFSYHFYPLEMQTAISLLS